MTVIDLPNKVSQVVQVSPDELQTVMKRLDRISELQLTLGAEYERHLGEVARLRAELEKARQSYASIVEVLADHYVKKQGKYIFQPSLGGFSEQED